jgi:uncharacterized protein YbaR (Trm112 family)
MICCPTCQHPVPTDQQEGVLINQVARQGALVVELRERAARARVPGLLAKQIKEAQTELDTLRQRLAVVAAERERRAGR